MVGFALGATTLSASADTQQKEGSIQVTANVAGYLPRTAPTILQPTSGQTFVTNPVTVSGDCTSGLIVELRKNGFIAGSVRCADNGSYILKIDLLLGSNTLIARQFNDLGGSAPSNIVTVTYKPFTVTGNQLLLQTDTMSQAAGIGESLSWKVTIIGGTGPYAITWDWGDGTVDVRSTETAGPYTFSHVYKQAGSHAIRVSATDKTGQTALLQLSEYTTGPTAFATGRDEAPGILLALWPLYCLLIMLLWTFYIGEHYGEVHERKHPHLEPNTPPHLSH